MMEEAHLARGAPEGIAARAAEARSAQELWRRYSLDERVRRVRGVWAEVGDAREKLFRVMHEESGSAKMDVEVVEWGRTDAAVKHYARHARRILGERHVARPWIYLNKRAFVRNAPWGLVGITTSRNVPLLAPVEDSLLALVAGNAVLLKPGPWAWRTAAFVEEVAEISGLLPKGLLWTAPGGDEAGLAVLRESDMLAFSGSVAGGREMALEAARQMKPATLELGGKHTMIVLDNAPLERAAKAAVWGAFSHAGQDRSSVQRALVEEGMFPRFAEAVVRETASLRQSLDYKDDVDVGRLACADHLQASLDCIQDAKDKGARIVGGELRDREHLLLAPAVILDASLDMKVMREDIPGPILAVMAARSGEEALRLASEGSFGFSASIWSLDSMRVETWTSYLDWGQVGVNDLGFHDRMASLPCRGRTGSSWIGRRGDEGLRRFCRPQSVSVHEWPADAPPWEAFPSTRAKLRILSWLNRFS